MSDGRLELDDTGRVLGPAAGGSVPERVDVDLVADGGRCHVPRWAVSLALAALVAGALWVSTRPDPPPVLAADVVGVGLLPPSGDGGPLVALYRVAPSAPGTTVSVSGLVGDGIRASTAYADPGGRGVRVAVVPDCLAAASSDLALDVRVVGPGGAEVRGTVPLLDRTVDWATAIENRCWYQATVDGVSLTGLQARADVARGLVRVDARLSNGTGRDLSVSAVDVADVATLETAPTAALDAARSTTVEARLTGRCGTLDSPSSLSWSVGPAGGSPRLSLTTPLQPAEQRTIAQAMAVLCSSPPATTVTLVSVVAAPPASRVAGERGAALELRFAVSSGAVLVALGDDPTGATADSRRAFSYTMLPGPLDAAEAFVRWDLVCDGVRPSAAIPLETRTQRLSFRTVVAVGGPAVDAAYRDACGRDVPAA